MLKSCQSGSRKAVVLLLIIFSALSICSLSAAADNLYHHESACSDVAKDVRVLTQKDGTATITALSKTTIPVVIGPNGSMSYCIDGLGSQNIQIAIDKKVGYTYIPRLKFKQEAVINIWKDGLVEVDKEGVEVTGPNGSKLISKKVKINNEKFAIVLIKKM